MTAASKIADGTWKAASGPSQQAWMKRQRSWNMFLVTSA